MLIRTQIFYDPDKVEYLPLMGFKLGLTRIVAKALNEAPAYGLPPMSSKEVDTKRVLVQHTEFDETDANAPAILIVVHAGERKGRDAPHVCNSIGNELAKQTWISTQALEEAWVEVIFDDVSVCLPVDVISAGLV